MSDDVLIRFNFILCVKPILTSDDVLNLLNVRCVNPVKYQVNLLICLMSDDVVNLLNVRRRVYSA